MLIEQLLRGVPDLEAIYLLVRPKHGAEPEARLDRLLSRPIFDSLRVAEEEEEDKEEAAADSSSSDVDSANDGGGERPSSSASTKPSSKTTKITDGVLQFKAPRRLLLPHLRAKLRVLSGDVCKPRCGLSEADARTVARGCDYFVHCAASISFFEHVHVLLEQNYVATRNVLDLAAEAMRVTEVEVEEVEKVEEKKGNDGGISSSPSPSPSPSKPKPKPRLRGMVHVSTAYVNANLKRGTHVEERIYPLVRETTDRRTGAKVKTVLSHAEVAAELLALPAAAATRAVDKLVAEFGFPNAYTLSKHLAEDAVADAVEGVFGRAEVAEATEEKKKMNNKEFSTSTSKPPLLRAAIVRPTIIGACAGGPAPGYFGNAAGPTQVSILWWWR